MPLLLLGGTVAIKVRLDLLRQTVASQKTLTASLLHGIDSLFQNYRRQIDTIAKLPEIQSMSRLRQLPVINEFLEQQRIFFGCTVYTSDGAPLLTVIRNQKDESAGSGSRNIDFKSPDVFSQSFLRVLATRKAAFVADETAEYQQKMLFVMVPVFDFVDQARVVGVINCSISVAGPGIHEIIGGFPIAKSDILLLLDRGGGLISSQGNLPEGFRGIHLPEMSGKFSESALINLADVTYLGTLAPVPEFEGYLFVARPQGLVLEFLNHLLLDLAIMLLIAFALAVALGFFMSRPLADSITALVAAIKNVSSGIVSHRLEVRGDDELSDASKAFNEMLNTLEKHRMMDDIWSREWEKPGFDCDKEEKDK
ncbi:MAG: HAMP domain-containing protein [Erysipelotrichia bacterium]|nr:HAMP domain-containing protein [Erysipelotrichia bacterium]